MTVITVIVKDDSNACCSVEVDSRERIGNVREMVSGKLKLSKDSRLLFAGRILRDHTVLDQVGVQHQSTLHVLRSTDGVGSGDAKIDEMPESLAVLQNHLLKNPDIMQQMMNTPAMQSLLGDMRFLKSILAMNPKVRHIMGPNSALSMMFDEPKFVQQALEAFRNPNMMRDLLRSTDKAMGQLGANSAGGGNANVLTKMHAELKGDLKEPRPSSKSGGVKEKRAVSKAGPKDLKDKRLTSKEGQKDEQEKENIVQRDFDPNAMAAMMQDPNLQQLLAQAFMAKDDENPLANPSTLAMLFRPSNMAGMVLVEESIAALDVGKAAKEEVFDNPHFVSTFSSFLQAQRENPELQYRTQLAAMRNMGFTDSEVCVQALMACDGSVQNAIDKILHDSRKT